MRRMVFGMMWFTNRGWSISFDAVNVFYIDTSCSQHNVSEGKAAKEVAFVDWTFSDSELIPLFIFGHLRTYCQAPEIICNVAVHVKCRCTNSNTCTFAYLYWSAEVEWLLYGITGICRLLDSLLEHMESSLCIHSVFRQDPWAWSIAAIRWPNPDLEEGFVVT